MYDGERTVHGPGGQSGRWYQWGIVAGLIACVTYPVAVFVPMAPGVRVVVGAIFGPALATACLALGRILLLRRDRVSAELGGYSGALAGALVTSMILVQLAVVNSSAPVGEPETAGALRRQVWDVILGLDVAFDMFIGLAMVLFGLAMRDDRRFGTILGWSGMVIGAVLVVGLNLWTFPEPPADAGLFDSGPFAGFWFLVVTLQVVRIYLGENSIATGSEDH